MLIQSITSKAFCRPTVKDSLELFRAAEELGAESLISCVRLGPNAFELHCQSETTDVSKNFLKYIFIVGQITTQEEIFLHDGCLSVHFCEQLRMNTCERGQVHRDSVLCLRIPNDEINALQMASSPQILDSLKPITCNHVFIQSYWNYCVSESAVESVKDFFPRLKDLSF